MIEALGPLGGIGAAGGTGTSDAESMTGGQATDETDLTLALCNILL